MDPRGKGVFLTGGARGLGRGIVEELLSIGAKVLFCDLNEERGRATEKELQKQYGADVAFFQPADVSDGQQLKAAFEAAVSKFKVVEICVNNAGMLDESSWEKMLAVNAGACIRGSMLALEHMRRDLGGHGGVIINVASIAGLKPTFVSPCYAASKHAIVGFTASWAMNPDQRDHGVRWCCLCPQAFQSELIDFKLRGSLYKLEVIEKIDPTINKMEVSQVVQAVIKLIRDRDNNGAILEVSIDKGAQYRRRQVVNRDGFSDLVVVDTY